MYIFGSGVLLGQRTDVANSTPVNFGLVQEVTLDISFDTKELYGQNQFPLAIGRGKAKFTGKAKVARISGLAYANLFFGQTVSTGQVATQFGESGTVGSSPYTITVANSATWVNDFGVLYATTGLPLTRVASAPAVGQYSVAAGVYTFNASDTGKAMLLSYTYTVSASGEQFTVTNQLMGTTPTFQATFYGKDPTTGDAMNVQIYNATASKLSQATKLDDFMIPEFDFSIFAGANGDVMNISFGEAA